MAYDWVRLAPPDLSELMYGALEEPITWLYAWFSKTTTRTWSGEGTEPAACARVSAPKPVHTPNAAAARATADATVARVRRYAELTELPDTSTSGEGEELRGGQR